MTVSVRVSPSSACVPARHVGEVGKVAFQLFLIFVMQWHVPCAIKRCLAGGKHFLRQRVVIGKQTADHVAEGDHAGAGERRHDAGPPHAGADPVARGADPLREERRRPVLGEAELGLAMEEPAQLDEMAGRAGLHLEHRWADPTGTDFDGEAERHLSVYRRPQ